MDISLHIFRKRLMNILIAATVLLTVLNLVHQISWYFWQQDYGLLGWRFDIGGDETVPTWFSSLILLICTILLALTAQVERNQPYPATRHWQALALVFLALSIDETATLHEWSSSLLSNFELQGIFYYSWVLFGLGFVLLLGLAYSRFYWRLPSRLKVWFFLAAALYVGGALIVEMMNARQEYLFGAQTLTYQAMTAVEELMEMAGILVFINALLQHLETRLSSLTLMFGTRETRQEITEAAVLPTVINSVSSQQKVQS